MLDSENRLKLHDLVTRWALPCFQVQTLDGDRAGRITGVVGCPAERMCDAVQSTQPVTAPNSP